MTKPTLMSVTAEYCQDPDDNHRGQAEQALTLEMTHAGAGPYLVIRTERWAMDHPVELADVINTFAARVEPLFGGPDEPSMEPT